MNGPNIKLEENLNNIQIFSIQLLVPATQVINGNPQHIDSANIDGDFLWCWHIYSWHQIGQSLGNHQE